MLMTCLHAVAYQFRRRRRFHYSATILMQEQKFSHAFNAKCTAPHLVMAASAFLLR